MSVHSNSTTSQSGSFSALLDSDKGLVDAGHYTSNFTRHRPPHRNDRNLSPSQYNGPMTDSNNAANDGLATGRGNGYNPQGYAGSAQSTTDSTAPTMVREGGTVAETPTPRKHLLYWINRDYDAPTERRLTEQAVDALNHDSLGGGDIGEWITRGVYAVGRGAAASPGSAGGGPNTSVVVLGHGPHSRVTLATTTGSSSGSRGSSSSHHHYYHDRMAENVCAAGWQFDDVPAFPARRAENIDDADIA
ncbi:hypothetical protein F5X96DRAFT_661674 [Biscogniauxia mediterranea]|nr:hypothetical protein F5X96DRAFT_661674 [Biscogniauxia mediterranea]